MEHLLWARISFIYLFKNPDSYPVRVLVNYSYKE